MGNIFDPPNPGNNLLAQLLAEYDPSRLTGLLGHAAAPTTSLASLFGATTGHRSRSSWNDRFEHWQRPESVTEKGTIESAFKNVMAALDNSGWLVAQKVWLHQQGSYLNRTNVRQEADIDLRLVHPSMKVDYALGVIKSSADTMLAYVDSGMIFAQIFQNLRSETVYHLGQAFGSRNVDATGNKAIRVEGITGSRAEVDVVPSLIYRHVSWNSVWSRYETVEGIAILGKDGSWTINYPTQHHENGKAKRARTAHRFKKMVRIFKRMRSDLPNGDALNAPSFLVECLVYMVEDSHFLFEEDDHYGRVRRIALRMRECLNSPLICAGLREVNDIKPLFGTGQAWAHGDAVKFVDAVLAHLGVS